MILELKNDFQALYLDSDEERFHFYTKHLNIEEYLAYWREGLERLSEARLPVLLPTYVEYDGDMQDLQGYVVYPYKSAWVLIDSGVRMPRTNDISKMHEYIDVLSDQLPEDENEWQSHWWLTGDDLSRLSSCIGGHLNFEGSSIPTKPLVVRRDDEKMDIYADKKRFDINFESFKNKEEVKKYSKQQVEDFISKDRAVAIVPAVTDDEKMWLYCFFNNGKEGAYVAQFSLPCHDHIADFAEIEAYLRARDYRPYVIKEDPQVYTLHARYTANTIDTLLQVL